MPLAIYIAALAIAAGFGFCFLPQFTRPDLFFAVTVPPVWRRGEDARKILAAYRREIVLHTAIAAVGALLVGRYGPPAASPLLLLWLMLGMIHAFLHARHRTRAHAVLALPQIETQLARDAMPGGWPAQAGPFVLLAIGGLILRLIWARIPARFPVHWDWRGVPNGWEPRTAAFFIFHIALAVCLCALLAMGAWLVARRSRLIHLQGPASVSERKFRRATMIVLLAVEYLLAVTISGILLMPAFGWSGRTFAVAMALFGLALAAASTVYLLRMGQGGSRLAHPLGDVEAVGDRTPDSCWKWGLFYYNPDDPALMVEKRFGVGYTMNMAHPAGWIVLAVAVAFTLAALARVSLAVHRP